MDNQTATKNINVKKILFATLGVVLLGEVIWSGWMILKPSSPTPPIVTQTETKATSITLNTPKTKLSVGEKFDVTIYLASSKKTDGTDLIINYDPKLLTVEKTSSPVVLGKIYTDYPSNTLDSKLGKITASGITTKTGGVLAEGIFGTITFTAKVPGQTKISLDFTPDSTVDTNVIESGSSKDVLEKVNNLEINIQ